MSHPWWVRSLPCILANIRNSSAILNEYKKNIINHVGLPSSFTIANTSYMNLRQHGGVPGICLWSKYAWSWQMRFTNLWGLALNWEAVIEHRFSIEQYLYYLILSFVQLWIVQKKVFRVCGKPVTSECSIKVFYLWNCNLSFCTHICLQETIVEMFFTMFIKHRWDRRLVSPGAML